MTTGQSAPLVAHPEFIWDAARLRLAWANDAGVAFWGEDSLLDLTERVFAPGDETVRALAAREAEMLQGDATGHVTLYPQGDPLWARVVCLREQRTDGRLMMRVVLEQVEAVNDPALVRKRAGFDAAPRPMAIYDEGGHVLVRNEADRRACPLGGNDISARYEAEGQGARALSRTLAEGAYSHTALIRTATGPLRHRISLQRMRDPATARRCVVADFTDLSDRPALSSSPVVPETSDHLAGRVVSARSLARIAHDIRAPLGAISGFAEMLRVMGDALPTDRRTGALEDISAACERLTKLSDRIIALGTGTGTGTGKGTVAGAVTLEMVDIGAACETVGRLFAAQAEAAGMSLVVEGQPGLMTLADENSVMRILDNLLRNALTHGAQEGGCVSVRTGGGQNGQAVWVEISDDGPGMSSDRIHARLDAFSATDDAADTDQKPDGLGLGNVMALAKEMVAEAQITTAANAGFATRIVFSL